MTRTHRLLNPASAFLLTAIGIVGVCFAIVRSQHFLAHPDVAAWGITFDLTITMPVVYWLIVVRGGRARPLTIAPLFLAGAAIAAMLLPRSEQSFLHQLRIVAAPLDILTLVLVGRKLLQLRRGAAAEGDTVERIGRAAQALFGDGAVAAAVSVEISILWYALFCWRKNMDVPRGKVAVTVHQRAGWDSVVACILVLIVAESIGLHLLLQLWSVKAAWTATALDLYAILWLIGDYHALRLRPTLLGNDSIEVRYGFRWTATIDRSNIAAVERVRGEEQWKRRGTLRLAMLDDPQFVITLRTPVIAAGIAGLRRTIDAIAIRPDDAASFLTALETTNE